jgi:hypothetical protein|tara:strand:+ start:2497 stop:2715 length:219 start_codon:yes stop_codon:yes gene_type:complete
MTKSRFNNKTLERSLEEVLKDNTSARKGSVSGFSIEVMEGNAFSSYVYYDDEKSCDEDLKTLTELLEENLDN